MYGFNICGFLQKYHTGSSPTWQGRFSGHEGVIVSAITPSCYMLIYNIKIINNLC